MVTTVCCMCSSECGLVATSKPDGRIVLRGDPTHPMNHGGVCPKLALAEPLRVSAKRLLTPMRRVGPRGTGRFEAISWETALDDIAARLADIRKRYGAESLTVMFGEKPDQDPLIAFARQFGTPNVLDHNSLCDSSRRIGFRLTLGVGQERPLPDLYRPVQSTHGLRVKHDCRLLVLFGENPAEARRFYWLWEGIREAKLQGMQLVVADPYESRTAQLANRWLSVRPGTDAALIVAMLRYAIEHDGPEQSMLDHAFIEHYMDDWPELRKEMCTSSIDVACGEIFYTPAWAARITGLNEEDVIFIAHLFATTKPAAASIGMNGVSHQRGGFDAARALSLLLAVTGNLDKPGGVVLRAPPLICSLATALGYDAASEWLHKDQCADFPLASFGVSAQVPKDIIEGVTLSRGPRAGHKYSTRALFVTHHNPLLTAPESSAWREALTARDRLEPEDYQLKLMVVNDTVAHDTAIYGDYLLPMAHFLERQGIVCHETPHTCVSLRQALAPLPFGVRSPLVLAKGLASRLNDDGRFDRLLEMYDDDWCEAVLNPLVQQTKQDLYELRHGSVSMPLAYYKYQNQGFATPSGRIEAFPVFQRGRVGFIDTSAATLLTTAPQDIGSTRQFQLVSGRSLHHTHSLTQHLGGAARMRAPWIYMNHDDAIGMGILDGDIVRLRNHAGRHVTAAVRTIQSIRSGVLRGFHGWGGVSPFLGEPIPDAYNLNELTSASKVHPISGNALFGELWVQVEKVL